MKAISTKKAAGTEKRKPKVQSKTFTSSSAANYSQTLASLPTKQLMILAGITGRDMAELDLGGVTLLAYKVLTLKGTIHDLAQAAAGLDELIAHRKAWPVVMRNAPTSTVENIITSLTDAANIAAAFKELGHVADVNDVAQVALELNNVATYAVKSALSVATSSVYRRAMDRITDKGKDAGVRPLQSTVTARSGD